ncbi:MAG: thioredoxin family protein [Betaproteobacteria bacterium]
MLRHLLLLLLLVHPLPLRAQPVDAPHVRVGLLPGASHARPGETFLVGLRLEHEPGWHTYWKNPGDSGMPTRLAWTLPPGVTAGPILWPAPVRIPVGPLANYGYEGDTLLLTEIRLPSSWSAGSVLSLAARADWLVCKDICLPGNASLALEVPTAASRAQPGDWGSRFDQVRSALPAPMPAWGTAVSVTPDNLVIALTPPSGTPPVAKLAFFPSEPDVIDNPAPQILEQTPGGYRLRLTAAPKFTGEIPTLSGVLVAEAAPAGAGPEQAIAVAMPYPGGVPAARAAPARATLSAADIQSAAAPVAGLGLLTSLVFAFAGGLVLNLMPCVFPVVSIKVLGFVEQARGDRHHLRFHGLTFAAGILVSFWLVAGALLALRASGLFLGWGYQLQSPPVVAGLSVLFFVLGLNLSGLFEFGSQIQSAAGAVGDRDGLAGAFLGGALATAVATPCTAPFMGAALGFALTQPPSGAMLVFTALALGMAAPYVLLSFFPALAARLPRPGRWMETLRQFLAFPLYLTVVWLVWVLAEQLGTTAAARLLAALVLVAAALWAWTRFAGPGHRAGRLMAGAMALAAAFLAWPTGKADPLQDTTGRSAWAPYSDAALSDARARGPVFVDFTAAWCVTCQVNKRVVLEAASIVEAFEKRRVKRLRADWTNRDDSITQALARLGRSGVPVYALYPAGGGAPELLSEILTPDGVVAALDRAAPTGR